MFAAAHKSDKISLFTQCLFCGPPSYASLPLDCEKLVHEREGEEECELYYFGLR